MGAAGSREPHNMTARAITRREEAEAEGLASTLSKRWSLPTALAFLAWFVFAPQCLSTIAVARRETNGWKWPAFMLAYLFALAYLAAGCVLDSLSLVLLTVQDSAPAQIARTDIEAALAPFDLKNQLSSNRTQGIPNMIALIRETAARYAG